MSHRSLLEDRIVALLGASSRYLDPWHSEAELEDFLVRQGFDRDLVLEVMDRLIDRGTIDFTLDATTGDFLISPPKYPTCYTKNFNSRQGQT